MVGRQSRDRQTDRVLRRHVVGEDDQVGGRSDGVLGVSPTPVQPEVLPVDAQVRRTVLAEAAAPVGDQRIDDDALAEFDTAHSLAQRVDASHDVAAQDVRQRDRDARVALADHVVDLVQARGRDLDSHLAGPRLRAGEVVAPLEHLRAAVSAERDAAHRFGSSVHRRLIAVERK